MTDTRGQAFLLKLSTDPRPGEYHTVAGLRLTALSISGKAVARTDKTASWRGLLPRAGVRSVSISAEGIFLGRVAEAETRALALAGQIVPCRLSFEDVTKLTSECQGPRFGLSHTA